MVLVFHILVAITSLGYTTYLFLLPSKRKFIAAYSMVGLTLISGTYLVVSTNSPLLQACASGLAYLGIVSAGLAAAHYRLVKQTERSKID